MLISCLLRLSHHQVKSSKETRHSHSKKDHAPNPESFEFQLHPLSPTMQSRKKWWWSCVVPLDVRRREWLLASGCQFEASDGAAPNCSDVGKDVHDK